MSIDNVIGVAGAAKGSVPLLVFGLVVSIPLVVVGAQMIMKLIERLPWLVIAGGGLLGYIAGEIAVEDAAIREWVAARASYLHVVAPIVGVAIVVAIGIWLTRRQRSAAPAD
jgi:predicted tellurium resistance membrane protein TerC